MAGLLAIQATDDHTLLALLADPSTRRGMHLLVAAHDLYPDPGSGGTGRYVYETARRFVDRGHRVSVVTRRRGDVPERERRDGIDVCRYDIEIAGESAPSIAAQLPGAAESVARFAAPRFLFEWTLAVTHG